VLLVGLISWGTAGGQGATSPVEAGKVFVGPEGLTLAIVPLRPRSGNKVLVQVSRSGTLFDGKVLLHEVEDQGGKADFVTLYRGRRWITIAVREGWWQARSYSVHVPGRRDGPTVQYDEKGTAALNADEVHRAWRKQEADGTLRAIAAFDRKREIAEKEVGIQKAADDVARSCGAVPAVTVDWPSLSDADIQELSLATYCGEPLSTMAAMCRDSEEAKKAISAGVKTFVCKMGKEMGLDLQNTTLTWTTSRSGRNMGDFTRKYLEKKL
jgi:hypothetical protein